MFDGRRDGFIRWEELGYLDERAITASLSGPERASQEPEPFPPLARHATASLAKVSLPPDIHAMGIDRSSQAFDG